MTDPKVTIFGKVPKNAEQDPDVKRLQQWAQHGGKPDKELAELIRSRLVDTENWRAMVTQSLQQVSELCVAHQHPEGLDCPSKRTEEYQAGRAQGRYEAFGIANRWVVDVVNRAGLGDSA